MNQRSAYRGIGVQCQENYSERWIFGFNGRPLATLARLSQTISGRPQRNRLHVSQGRRGRIWIRLPFGQINNNGFIPALYLLNFQSRSDGYLSPATLAGS